MMFCIKYFFWFLNLVVHTHSPSRGGFLAVTDSFLCNTLYLPVSVSLHLQRNLQDFVS